LKQGHEDGLCGIYSLLNFFQNEHLFTDLAGKSQFWIICEVAERLGLLKADHIANGYAAYQLKEIFDAVCSKLCLPYRSELVREVGRHLEENQGAAFKKIVDQGGALIFMPEDGHWALLHGYDESGFHIDNSGRKRQTSRMPECGYEDMPSEAGVVLISETPKVVFQ